MSRKLDWGRANEKPARTLSWKEQRLDRAADNWMANGSLNRNPKPLGGAATGSADCPGAPRAKKPAP